MLFIAKQKSNSTATYSIVLSIFWIMLICLGSLNAQGEIRLSKDWRLDDLPHQPHPVVLEADQFDAAVEKTANTLSAVPKSKGNTQAQYDEGFKLYIDKTLYYVNAVLFAPKRHPGDVCTPKRAPKQSFDCVEGQRLAQKAHLFFYNEQFENIGVYQFKIAEPYEYFANAVPAMGVYDKDRNELLINVQYFSIDHKKPSKTSKLDSSRKRMTMLVRIKVVDGKIEAEQDDACLKNPNAIEKINDARKILKRCHSKIQD